MIGIFSCAFLFEGIRTLKEFHLSRFLRKQESRVRNSHPKLNGMRILDDDNYNSVKECSEKKWPVRTAENEISCIEKSDNSFFGESIDLLISSVLHMIHVCLGYCLMLVVMTFNLWIFLAVIFGVSMGFFSFDNLRRKFAHPQRYPQNMTLSIQMTSSGLSKSGAHQNQP